jgi:hypothetical protein
MNFKEYYGNNKTLNEQGVIAAPFSNQQNLQIDKKSFEDAMAEIDRAAMQIAQTNPNFDVNLYTASMKKIVQDNINSLTAAGLDNTYIKNSVKQQVNDIVRTTPKYANQYKIPANQQNVTGRTPQQIYNMSANAQTFNPFNKQGQSYNQSQRLQAQTTPTAQTGNVVQNNEPTAYGYGVRNIGNGATRFGKVPTPGRFLAPQNHGGISGSILASNADELRKAGYSDEYISKELQKQINLNVRGNENAAAPPIKRGPTYVTKYMSQPTTSRSASRSATLPRQGQSLPTVSNNSITQQPLPQSNTPYTKNQMPNAIAFYQKYGRWPTAAEL